MSTAKFRTKAGVLGAACMATAGVLFSATPAQAADYKVTSNCSVSWINCSNEPLFFLFYNSKQFSYKDGNFSTSWSTFYGNVSNYYGSSRTVESYPVTYRYIFNGNGKGSREYMKNNAASAMNCAEKDGYRVYYNSGYGGTSQYFGPNGLRGNCNHTDLISALKNNNASQHFA